ncbi:MAG: bifunctional glutamate N-acetyltransferase/amino-acid acetyltransferase ArgJ [Candidatus Omnitrophica bacterium]|nr:bifunctional glutamate N-acetyltransferase/amino-acid acetyltransferase ArgJ [Candidatus Omnitrophota bacterium]
MKQFKKIILPKGFKANAVACGLKKSGKLDFALLYSEVPAKASCMFTTNTLAAAPVQLSRKHLKSSQVFRAVVVNSGNANSFTGRQGVRDAENTTRLIGSALGVRKESVLVASTGIIGKRLAFSSLKAGIIPLIQGISSEGIHRAKRAIMTTDTFVKEVSLRFSLGATTVTLSGIAKGAGMIAPNMATMLALICTDTAITQRALNKAFSHAVERSFNAISIDGCMSTNDSVMMLANGAAGNRMVDTGKYSDLFTGALVKVCDYLAQLIVHDAEGATKFIRIEVAGAHSPSDAKKAALMIANSNLFKTAMYGQNPNFGRIVAAIGASGIKVREKDCRFQVSPLHKKDIQVKVSIGRGGFSSVVYTSDLTPEYIRINAEYN